MDPTWVGIIISFCVGAGGLIFALVGRRDARAANKLAAAANNIANGAVNTAERSNLIALEANGLSAEANSLVGRTVSRDEESWFVEWTADWNAPSATLVLHHRGKEIANKASVVVAGENLHHLATLGDVPAGTDQTVELPEVLQQRQAFERKAAIDFEEMKAKGILYFGNSFHPDVTITVLWSTGMATPRDQRISLQLS